MSDSQEITRVTESIDGAVMEEIGSPDGGHLEEVFIDEPDVAMVYDGNIIEDVDLTEEEEVDETVETTTDDEAVVEEVETVEEFDEESVEASPDDESEVTPEGAPEGDIEGASPTTDEPRDPFNYRADGQDFEVSGSYVEDDNIVIPRESWLRDVQPRLADRNAWITERREYLQQIEDLAPENNPQVVKANTLLEKLDAAFEDEESAYAFFKNFNSNRDKLFLEADRKAFEAEKERTTSRQQRESQETEVQQIREQMDQSIDTVLKQASGIEQYAGVDFDYVRNLIDQTKNSFFFRAPEDLPQFGMKKGEIGIDIQKIESVIQAEAARSVNRSENEGARRRNESVLSDRTEEEETAPPAPEPDTPQVTESTPEITSKEDWDAHIAAVAAGAR